MSSKVAIVLFALSVIVGIVRSTEGTKFAITSNRPGFAEMPREKVAQHDNNEPCALPSENPTSSLWLSQLSPLLVGHRSTSKLPGSADLVIIGSGMTGTSVAHHLLEALANGNTTGTIPNVVMLEAREACSGATGRNGGHCIPDAERALDPTVGDFELANFYAIKSLITEKSIDAAEFFTQSGVQAIYDTGTLAEVEALLDELGKTSPTFARLLRMVTDPSELETFRIPNAIGAAVTSVAARMWPYKFVARILEDLLTSSEIKTSFNLQTHTPVENIVRSKDGAWRIQTARGDIEASKVVVATNGYTSHLLPDFAELIVPVRGQMSALVPLPSVSGSGRLDTSFGFVDGDGKSTYLVQRPNEKGGSLMFGGGRRDRGTTDDSVVDKPTAEYLRRFLMEALSLPERNDGGNTTGFAATHEWTGIMGYSKDNFPWVGPVPGKNNMYMSAGFTGHGMVNTWLCGKALARMISESRLVTKIPSGSPSFDATNQQLLAAPSELDSAGEVDLPKAYLVTKERMQQAMEL